MNWWKTTKGIAALRILEVRVERALLCRQEWVGANGGAKYE